MIDLYESEGQLGFDVDGIFIADPFISECGRFEADPIKDYGLTASQVEEILHSMARHFMDTNSKPEWDKVSLDDWMYEHANDISDEVKAQGTAIIQGFENL
jgi:hypothetical protein